MKLLEFYPHRNPLDCLTNLKPYIKDKIVCDIGCGAGDLLEYMRENKLCKEVHGIEKDIARATNALKNGRSYVIHADATKHKIPQADVYFFWIGVGFPYVKIISQLPKTSLFVYLDSMEHHQTKFMESCNLELVADLPYEFDELKYIPENRKPEFHNYLEKMKARNARWKASGTRLCRIYRHVTKD